MNKKLSEMLNPAARLHGPLGENQIELLSADLDDVAGGWCIGFSCTTYEHQVVASAE